MTYLARHSLLLALVVLSGCSLTGPQPSEQPPVPSEPPQPSQQPGQPSTPRPSLPTLPPKPSQQQTHPRFAPPPGGNSYWDNGLSVYVIKSQPDLYYRDRTYYRWSDGWSWASSPSGPWQSTDSSGIPAGLGRKYPQ